MMNDTKDQKMENIIEEESKKWTVTTAFKDILQKSRRGDFDRPVFCQASLIGWLKNVYKIDTSIKNLKKKFPDEIGEIIELYDDFLQNHMNPEYMFEMWRIRFGARQNWKAYNLEKEVERLSKISVEQKVLKIEFDASPMNRVKK